MSEESQPLPGPRVPLDSTPRWLGGYRSWKYGVLLASLIALFVGQPFLSDGAASLSLLTILFNLTLLAAAVAAARTRRALVPALVLGLPALLTPSLMPKSDWASGLGSAFDIAFLAFALVMILADVLRSQSVTVDTLYGSLCGFLLLAALWAVGYALLESRHPGSISFAPSDSQGDGAPFSQMLYYSLITLTTVGYGDVTPVSLRARSLSALEGVTGQFYVSVLVARLVALHLSRRREPLE